MPAERIGVRRRNRKQTGQVIEKPTAFYVRYYVTTAEGKRNKVWKKLCDKSAKYQTIKDVAPLVEQELATNGSPTAPSSSQKISDFVESVYLPYVKLEKSAATENGYRKLWGQHWKPTVGHVALVDLRTDQITELLTQKAKTGLGRHTLGHIKWFLGGVYTFAQAKGVVPSGDENNPVIAAKWLCKVARPQKPKEYSLDEMRAMLTVLEQLDLRAAVAVALAYFAALRPAEIRGLQWADFDGEHLNIRRGVWRSVVGGTKTEDSAASVLVIEPLRGLLEKLRAQPTGESNGKPITRGELKYILDGGHGHPISLDSLNYRVIAPALEKVVEWRGYYPGRRGISSLITDTSKNALNSTGLLRHSTPITALKHYTRAQKASIEAALKTVEQMATN